MRAGDVEAVIVVPAGYGESLAAGGVPTVVKVYTDPSQSTSDGRTRQLIAYALGVVNASVTGPPAVVPGFESIQTVDFNFLSYLIPSILAMALVWLGVFAAIPLVADREKLILKRLGATPIRRWQLVNSNVLVRLLIAVVQTVIIVGIGTLLFGLETTDRWLLTAFFILLGSLTFIALGYLLASFTKIEESVNGVTQVVQQCRCCSCRASSSRSATMGEALQSVAESAAADLPRRRAPPGHGRQDAVRAAVGLHAGSRRLAGCVLRDRRPLLPRWQ